jgi:hypothetical protein
MLSDLGVTKMQSSRWQALARLAKEKFEEKLRRMNAAAANATTSTPAYSKADFTDKGRRCRVARLVRASRMRVRAG